MEFNVFRRRLCELCREMGLGHIGRLPIRDRDGDFCIGRNPQMTLTRTRTIMKNASHRDFRCRMKPEAER